MTDEQPQGGEPHDGVQPPTTPERLVLVVEDDPDIRRLVETVFRRDGFDVVSAADGARGLALARETRPDLIVSDVMMPELDGFALVRALRADPSTRDVPIILLTAKGETEDVVSGLRLGADDYLAKPFKVPELLARAHAKIERPPTPAASQSVDRRTGAVREAALVRALERELERSSRSGDALVLAYLTLDELPDLRRRFGLRIDAPIGAQVMRLMGAEATRLDLVASADQGGWWLLVPGVDADRVEARLERLTLAIMEHTFSVADERVRLTPVVGYAVATAVATPDTLRAHAIVASEHAHARLDLRPERFDPRRHADTPRRAGGSSRLDVWRERARLPLQGAMVLAAAIGVPFAIYELLARFWIDVTPVMYLVVVAALLVTATLIWVEGFLALRRVDPPDEPSAPYPAASAIIAAYLPNEAATVVETVRAFVQVDYPAPLQVILAYNTPRDLPVEATLREIAAEDPRFVPLRVEGSTSKAQNVNAALAKVTGAMVGVFDADHHPCPDGF